MDSADTGRVLSQAEVLEQKTDDMRDKYFKKQMQRLKKANVNLRAASCSQKCLRILREWETMQLNIAQQYKEMG